MLRFRVQKATSGQCGLDSRGPRVACGKDRLYCLRFHQDASDCTWRTDHMGEGRSREASGETAAVVQVSSGECWAQVEAGRCNKLFRRCGAKVDGG